MARISVDDKMLRDPRVIRLARFFGWRRQEAVGRLIDVYAVVYDRVDDIMDQRDVDIAAEQDGFADQMIAVQLATLYRDSHHEPLHRVRIKGASDRIAYLATREATGRDGGVKSGESRRNKREGDLQRNAKVTFTKTSRSPRRSPQGPVNPPDPVPDAAPDPVPDLALVPDPDPERERARTVRPASGWATRQAWWQEMLDADLRIKAAGIEPNAPSFGKTLAGEHEKNVLACERQLRDSGYSPEIVDEKMRHIVRVSEAVAIRERARKWFKPSVIWDPKHAMRDVDMTIDEARKPPQRAKSSSEKSPWELQMERVAALEERDRVAAANGEKK